MSEISSASEGLLRALTATAALVLVVGTAGHAAEHGKPGPRDAPREYSTSLVRSSAVEAWRSDLRALVEGLVRAGRRDDAIAAFRRALAIQADLASSRGLGPDR